MFELRDRPLRRVVLAPFADGGSLLSCLAAGFIAVGNAPWWLRGICGTYLALFLGRSYATRLEVTQDGLTITNRFWQRRLRWSDVRAVRRSRPGFGQFLSVLQVEHQRSRFLAVQVVASLGMTRSELERAADELTAIALPPAAPSEP